MLFFSHLNAVLFKSWRLFQGRKIFFRQDGIGHWIKKSYWNDLIKQFLEKKPNQNNTFDRNAKRHLEMDQNVRYSPKWNHLIGMLLWRLNFFRCHFELTDAQLVTKSTVLILFSFRTSVTFHLFSLIGLGSIFWFHFVSFVLFFWLIRWIFLGYFFFYRQETRNMTGHIKWR